MFGNTFLLLGPTLVPSATATAAIKIFDRADPPKPMTGANLVWETQITLMHSLFTNNATVVARCFATIFASAQVMPQPAEGIMVDGSFHQHGAELLAGSYGAAFTSCSLELLAFASGTPFYMTPAQCDAFSLLVLDGQSWMITPKTPMLDWSVIGREISRNPGVTKANFLPDQLRNVSCSRHVEFAALAARLDPNDSGGVPLVGHRHFYDSDYTVARSSGGKWTASVRMYSKRTVNARCVNREGVQDEHTADGVLNVYQDGTEYYKVPPVWDYMRLPGTVIRQAGRRPSCGTTVQSSPCEFVGGVSGGQLTTGTSAQQLVSRGLQQLRSWFFFDTAIVALASNMSLTNPADPTPESPVIMTLAAQALDGNVVIKLVGNDTPLTLPSGNRTYPAKHVEWILHKRLAYVCTPMPCGGEVEVVNMPVAGNWNTLGAQSGEVHTPLFSATVNLGPSPIVANMHLPPTGYIVFPESTVDTILHSLSLLDVVSDPAHLAVGAVLRTSSLTTFAGGVFPSSTGGVLDFGGLTVGVNAPSMVQYMDLANRTVVVAASSPTASTQVVAITVTTTLVCSTNDRVYLTSSSTAGTTLHMNLTAVAPGATVEARCTLQ
jgi:chondroitin AC lyase